MVAQGSGSIVVSSTVDALVGCAGLDSYTAAKGGVTSMVRSFAAGIGRSIIAKIWPRSIGVRSSSATDDRARSRIENCEPSPVPVAG